MLVIEMGMVRLTVMVEMLLREMMLVLTLKMTSQSPARVFT